MRQKNPDRNTVMDVTQTQKTTPWLSASSVVKDSSGQALLYAINADGNCMKRFEVMRMIYCYCESCKNHDDDDTCKRDSITISDREITAAGFLPQCQEYEEDE